MRLGLLLRGLRLLERRLGLLWLRLWRRGGSAESCASSANVTAARVDRARKMIRQTKPARCDYDEKFRVLKSTAF